MNVHVRGDILAEEFRAMLQAGGISVRQHIPARYTVGIQVDSVPGVLVRGGGGELEKRFVDFACELLKGGVTVHRTGVGANEISIRCAEECAETAARAAFRALLSLDVKEEPIPADPVTYQGGAKGWFARIVGG